MESRRIGHLQSTNKNRVTVITRESYYQTLVNYDLIYFVELWSRNNGGFLIDYKWFIHNTKRTVEETTL